MLAARLIHTAVAFFVVGVGLGIYMGVTHDFRLTHVHVHINLLGWVALGLIGVVYGNYPELQQSWLAQGHYWLHTAGLLFFMGGFAWGALDGAFKLAPVALGSTMIALGVLLFAIRVWSGLRHVAPQRAQ